MASSLLTTKLYFPLARTSLVSRPRLVDQLQAGKSDSLTLVSAPAGYGKTTLMSEWRAGVGQDFSTAWLSLDNDDNDTTRFLTYIIAALSSLKPDFGETTLALLQSSPPLSTGVILTSLINELGEVDKTFSFIFDDYHVITNHPIHEAVTYLLDHLPPQMHLVILTRADPPLPLSRLRARGQLTEIRAADLRFTTEEATAFLNQVMGLVLSKDQVEALEQRTEGWIAGLQLAALSMQGRDDLQNFVSAFTGSYHYIVDYLADEVLNNQSESVQDFLLRTSILDRMTAPLCDALTDRSDGQTMLEKLEHANLFLVPLDDEQHWYRYQHLFAEAIRNRLQKTHSDWLFSLYRSATEWYEQHGFVSEAVRSAIAGEDIERAAQLVERNALPMVMRRELVMLANWLKAVEALIYKRPWLCVYQAWVLFFSGQRDVIETYLQKAEHLVAAKIPTDRVEEQHILGQIAAIRTGLAFVHGDTTHVIVLAQQALENLPEDNLEARTLVTYALGGAFWLKGDINAASRAFEELDRTGRTAGNMPVVVMALCSLARLHSLKGQLRRAAEIYREAMQLASSQHGQLLPIAAEACAGLGQIFYEWNDLDAARDHLERYAEISQLSGVVSYRILSQVLLARLRQAQGDSIGAFDLLHQVEQLKERSALGIDTDTLFAAYRINIRLNGGDLESAARVSQEQGLSLEGARNWQREPEYSAFVRLLLAQGENDVALTLLNQLIRQAESVGLLGRVIELLVLQALVFHAKDAIPQALAALERSLSLAQEEGYMRVFLDEGTPMAELLRLAGSHGIAPKYVTKLLSEFDTLLVLEAAIPTNQPIVEPLSERELEILRLVAEGKSNRQIAEALFIATGTVKKHLNTIFGKLGAQSRTHCVARAREVNLL